VDRTPRKPIHHFVDAYDLCATKRLFCLDHRIPKLAKALLHGCGDVALRLDDPSSVRFVRTGGLSWSNTHGWRPLKATGKER
jgi:hypothetical protein